MDVAVLFSRFGPYHAARLRSAGAYFKERDSAVYGLEVAGSDEANHYLWEDVERRDAYEHKTLAPGQDYSALSTSTVRRLVNEALTNCSPDVVAINGWALPEAHAALGWCQSTGTPRVLMSTSQLFDYERSAPKEFIKRVLVAAFHSGFVGGRTHQEYLDRLGMPAEHVTWGYNAVENDYFRKKAADVRHESDALRAEHNLPDSYFLVVGRMVEEKNLIRLLKAYAAYHSEASHPIHLVVVGNGPLRQDFRIQVEAYNLNNAVHTPGFVQYDELPIYYGLAHSLLLPSIKDTWGLVVNEAMASGLPVVVSNRAGCSTHLVENGDNGYIISPYDVDEIEDALHRLSALPDEEYATMCQASSSRIKEWGPKRFAQGLWEAASRAQRRASTYTAPAHVRLMSRLVSFFPLSA